MLKRTNEANSNGHFSGSHAERFLWQGTGEQSEQCPFTIAQQVCMPIVSSRVPSRLSHTVCLLMESPTPGQILGTQKGPKVTPIYPL